MDILKNVLLTLTSDALKIHDKISLKACYVVINEK